MITNFNYFTFNSYKYYNYLKSNQNRQNTNIIFISYLFGQVKLFYKISKM